MLSLISSFQRKLESRLITLVLDASFRWHDGDINVNVYLKRTTRALRNGQGVQMAGSMLTA